MCRDVTALFSASDHGMRSTKASEVQGGFSGLVVRWNMYSKMELTIDDGVLLVAVVVFSSVPAAWVNRLFLCSVRKS